MENSKIHGVSLDKYPTLKKDVLRIEGDPEVIAQIFKFVADLMAIQPVTPPEENKTP